MKYMPERSGTGSCAVDTATSATRTIAMPYEIAFTKSVTILNREQYINECCVGGDVVASALLPAITARYTDIQHEQEDWGWFIWFRKADVKLAVDIFTDDADAGQFRIMLTSRKKKLLFDYAADTPELDVLRFLIVSELEKWLPNGITVSHERA